MRRREFITLLGVAATWPISSAAQQTDRVRRIGVLHTLGPDDHETQERNKAFEQALRELGWTTGRDLIIDTRMVGMVAGDPDRLRRYTDELIAIGPDVIIGVGSLSVPALQQATRTIPIVFVNVADPVGAGFVQRMGGTAQANCTRRGARSGAPGSQFGGRDCGTFAWH